jgi:enoyl-CoA hydratase/carnithine racemase
MGLGTILLIVLVLLLIGAIPSWPHSRNWGYGPSGGIGLVGNSDVIVAADDATFGLPEVDRGALGAATHPSRLVPQHKMRAMVYTSETATADELFRFGSVLRVVERDALRDYDSPFEEAAEDLRAEVARLRRALDAMARGAAHMATAISEMVDSGEIGEQP